MALTWVESDLVNGDFGSGTLSGWTVETGDPQVRDDDNAGVPLTYVCDGGPDNALSQISQSITIPQGAIAVQLSGYIGSNEEHWDQGSIWIRFKNGADDYIGGCYDSAVTDTSTARHTTIEALIPADAVACDVVATMARTEFQYNNGLVAGISSQFLIADADYSGVNVLVNPGFETGDLSGWTQETAASAGVTTDPLLVKSGIYAMYGGNQDNARYHQQVPIDAGTNYISLKAWLSLNNDDYDSVYFSLVYLDGADQIIESFEVVGPVVHAAQRQAAFFKPVPVGAVSARAAVRWRLREGGVVNVTIDDVELFGVVVEEDQMPIPPEPPEVVWPDPEVWPPDYECAISYPCCLPAPLVAGHGYESSSRVRRNDLASGPPIYTLEDDDGYELFNVSWSFNNVETQIFRNFYRHTIASGSKEFCIDLMVDGWNGTNRTKTHRVYFEGQPQYSLHGLRWNVSATLLAIQEQINDECDGLLLAEAYCVFTSGLAWAMADLHDIVENVLWEAP